MRVLGEIEEMVRWEGRFQVERFGRAGRRRRTVGKVGIWIARVTLDAAQEAENGEENPKRLSYIYSIDQRRGCDSGEGGDGHRHQAEEALGCHQSHHQLAPRTRRHQGSRLIISTQEAVTGAIVTLGKPN